MPHRVRTQMWNSIFWRCSMLGGDHGRAHGDLIKDLLCRNSSGPSIDSRGAPSHSRHSPPYLKYPSKRFQRNKRARFHLPNWHRLPFTTSSRGTCWALTAEDEKRTSEWRMGFLRYTSSDVVRRGLIAWDHQGVVWPAGVSQATNFAVDAQWIYGLVATEDPPNSMWTVGVR